MASNRNSAEQMAWLRTWTWSLLHSQYQDDMLHSHTSFHQEKFDRQSQFLALKLVSSSNTIVRTTFFIDFMNGIIR